MTLRTFARSQDSGNSDLPFPAPKAWPPFQPVFFSVPTKTWSNSASVTAGAFSGPNPTSPPSPPTCGYWGGVPLPCPNLRPDTPTRYRQSTTSLQSSTTPTSWTGLFEDFAATSDSVSENAFTLGSFTFDPGADGFDATPAVLGVAPLLEIGGGHAGNMDLSSIFGDFDAIAAFDPGDAAAGVTDVGDSLSDTFDPGNWP